jgi:hypothetical protein
MGSGGILEHLRSQLRVEQPREEGGCGTSGCGRTRPPEMQASRSPKPPQASLVPTRATLFRTTHIILDPISLPCTQKPPIQASPRHLHPPLPTRSPRPHLVCLFRLFKAYMPPSPVFCLTFLPVPPPLPPFRLCWGVHAPFPVSNLTARTPCPPLRWCRACTPPSPVSLSLPPTLTATAAAKLPPCILPSCGSSSCAASNSVSSRPSSARTDADPKREPHPTRPPRMRPCRALLRPKRSMVLRG